MAASSQPPGVPLNDSRIKVIAPQALTYDAYGDSITAGYDASVPANAYVNLLGSALGLTTTNHGVSGSEAIDQEPAIYAQNVSATGSQLFTYMIGMNDGTFLGSAGLTNYSLMHEAELAWLAIPASNKTVGQNTTNITYAGTWAATSAYWGGTMSMQSSTNGSTATYTDFGPTLYLAYGIDQNSTGTFSVTVDGVLYGNYVATGIGQTLVSNLGASHGSALLRMTGLSNTTHTVVLTVTSATSSSATVWFDWYARPGGANFFGGPQVIAGGVTRRSTTDNVQIYTTQAIQDVSRLASDGLNIAYADTPDYINTATDIISDGTHPNDTGEVHIFNAFWAAINTASTGRVKSAALAANAAIAAGPLTGQIISGLGSTITSSGSNNAILGGGDSGANTISSAGSSNVIVGGYANSIASGGTVNTNANLIGGGNNNHIANGGRNSILGGYSNTATNFYNTVLGGENNTTTGRNSIVGGYYSNDQGRFSANCFASGRIAISGDAQACEFVLRASSTSTTPVRLTADGNAASSTNCVNLPVNFTFGMRMLLVGQDDTTAAARFTWAMPAAMLGQDSTAASTTLALGTPVILSAGAGSSTSVSATADITNACLNVTVTPPNTDSWHWTLRVSDMEGG